MRWAADEEMEEVLETPSHLLTNKSARLVETGWPVKAPTACSHLCFAGIIAAGEEEPGDSWPTGLADTASLRSHVSMTYLWPQPHAAPWPSAAPAQPFVLTSAALWWAVGGVQGALWPLRPWACPTQGSELPGELQVQRAEG